MQQLLPVKLVLKVVQPRLCQIADLRVVVEDTAHDARLFDTGFSVQFRQTHPLTQLLDLDSANALIAHHAGKTVTGASPAGLRGITGAVTLPQTPPPWPRSRRQNQSSPTSWQRSSLTSRCPGSLTFSSPTGSRPRHPRFPSQRSPRPSRRSSHRSAAPVRRHVRGLGLRRHLALFLKPPASGWC